MRRKNWVAVFVICAFSVCSASAARAAAPRKKIPAEPIVGESLDGRSGRRIDIVFVVDVTGSMRLHWEFVPNTILNTVNALLADSPRPDVRFGLVIYRDREEAFVARTFPFTRDLADFQHNLSLLYPAMGGMDPHEDVAAALAAAIHMMEWDMDRNVERYIYLIGDAPPHPEYTDAPDVSALAVAAYHRGITVHTIACSLWGELVDTWRMIARIAGGTTAFLLADRAFDSEGNLITVFADGGDLFIADGDVAIASWAEVVELAKNGKLRKARPGDIHESLWKDGDGAAIDRYLIERIAEAEAETLGEP